MQKREEETHTHTIFHLLVYSLQWPHWPQQGQIEVRMEELLPSLPWGCRKWASSTTFSNVVLGSSMVSEAKGTWTDPVSASSFTCYTMMSAPVPSNFHMIAGLQAKCYISGTVPSVQLTNYLLQNWRTVLTKNLVS